MKLFKYGLPIAALALLASCSDDKFDVTTGGGNDSSVDGIYMTLKIAPVAQTRTGNSGVGSEVGQDDENTIGDVLVLFADDDDTVITSATFSVTASGSNGTTYTTRGKVVRQNLLTKMGQAESLKFNLFAIANPKTGMEGIEVGDDVNTVILNAASSTDNVFSVTDLSSIWAANSFLMTGYKPEVTLQKTDIATGHNTPETALPLTNSNIQVHRSAARFDMYTENNNEDNEFYFKEDGSVADDSTDAAITVKLDGFALVNMSPALYTFKNVIKFGEATSNPYDYIVDPDPEEEVFAYFGDEGSTEDPNWVMDPKFVVSPISDLSSFEFEYPVFTGSNTTRNDASTYTYTTFADLLDLRTAGNPVAGDGSTIVGDRDKFGTKTWNKYNIWRYSTPNTPLDQVNGKSTGIVFRAILSVGEYTNEDANDATKELNNAIMTDMQDGETVYAYGNVIYGSIATLQDLYIYTEDEDGNKVVNTEANFAVRRAYTEAVAAAKEAEGWIAAEEDETAYDNETDETNQGLIAEKLVSKGFTAYEATEVEGENVYYCYYYYWNRHNDNGEPGNLGKAEFGVVRNNIYKLAVTGISKLGRPDKNQDDPDPFTPDTPDESLDFYMSVTCEVVPWVVRVNNIEF